MFWLFQKMKQKNHFKKEQVLSSPHSSLKNVLSICLSWQMAVFLSTHLQNLLLKPFVKLTWMQDGNALQPHPVFNTVL